MRVRPEAPSRLSSSSFFILHQTLQNFSRLVLHELNDIFLKKPLVFLTALYTEETNCNHGRSGQAAAVHQRACQSGVWS